MTEQVGQHNNKALNGKRLVIKVGSSLVTNGGQGVHMESIQAWAAQIATLTAQGCEVVLVSSGAIAEGLKRLGWSKRPKEINELQAAAAVGQMGLVHAYEMGFAAHGMTCAQVLLTHADLADRERYLNARSTLTTLMHHKVVPIINENDTVVTDEIRFGDNDTLGALVTNLVEADALVILTDQVGLFDSDPRKNPNARFIHEDTAGNPELEKMAGGAGSSVGTGGMITKILAAKRAARSGAATVIASGREANVLVRLMQGESVGTFLKAPMGRLAARKQWMADHLKMKGALLLDAGAAVALRAKKGSLLPIGVTGAQGQFQRGDVVACLSPEGEEVARGLVNYSAAEVNKIAKQPTSAIESILGYLDEPELIHRDNMVVLS
ncbi:MAG TPA: glutamate 5-kinase [Limnobacter sp.]|uniref:glutamate 5-kinase n=1 Tax=Limnobacter sp. TaxID=2003368 RepID=UPI002EDACB33